MIVSRIPYRETEDYIADSVAVLALESYEKQSKDIFSLCDLGCGNGFLTFFLNKKKYSAIGFDYSQTAIDQGIEIDNEFNLGLKNGAILFNTFHL